MRIVVVAPVAEEQNSVTQAFLEVLQQEISQQSAHSVSVVVDKTHNILSRFFFASFKLSSLFKKLNPEVVIQLTGAFIKQSARQLFVLSERTVMPQKSRLFWEKKTYDNRVQIMKTDFAFASSDVIREKLAADYDIDEKRSGVLFSLPSAQIDWQQREHIKSSFTPEGSEYFYSDARFASKKEVIDLLKAFSIFKKWQRSSMHLIIRVRNINALEEESGTYKFRGDITFTQNDDALIAAYAVVQMFDDINAPVIAKASAAQVAVITRDSEDLPSTRNDLFLVVNNDVEHTGQAMISLYKNEQRRNNLASAAHEHYTKQPVSILDILSRFNK